MKKQKINIIALILAFAIGAVFGYLLPKNQPSAELISQQGDATQNPEGEEAKLSDSAEGELPETVAKENSLLALQEELTKELEGCEGEWSIYVEALSNGDYIEINNRQTVSASLIKLFVMGRVFQEIENETILLEDVKIQLEDMITISDNEATNELVALLGGGEYTNMKGEAFQEGLKLVNTYAKKMKFTHTDMQRDLKDSRPEPITEQNYTSVTDCGRFLSMLYRGELVSPELDAKMLELLKAQTRTGKIPAGLPDGTVCANKTGELSTAENDAAIVFSPGEDYVLCIISNDLTDTAKAREQIVHISELVYQYFNAN